jgi:hypothetical protein
MQFISVTFLSFLCPWLDIGESESMFGHGPEEPGKRVVITASQGSRIETEKNDSSPRHNLILQRRNNRWNALGR